MYATGCLAYGGDVIKVDEESGKSDRCTFQTFVGAEVGYFLRVRPNLN